MKRDAQGKTAFDLIEEATHLLRTGPSGLLACYYIGAVPFILGLLYFWADMSGNPFAAQHSAEAALCTAILFLWMKFCQAIFARRLRAIITAEPLPRLQFQQASRILLTQTILQPLGLLPIGLCLAGFFTFTPIGLMLAVVVGALLPFFHNVTALADGTEESTRKIFKKAWRLWWLWPRQNITMLAICYFFGLYVFLNWSILCVWLPHLVKMLFSIESVFTRNPFAMLNTTFVASMFGLTYLCVDPILKTLYALRCFYGESVKSGEDLKADLKRFSLPPQATIAAVVLLLMFGGAAVALGAENSPADPQVEAPRSSTPANNGQNAKNTTISSPDLDHSIDQTIHERKYTWRMPRDKTPVTETDKGVIGRFLEKIVGMIRKCAQAISDWMDKWWRKLFGHRATPTSHTGSGQGWITSLQIFFFVLIAVVVCALAILIYRLLQQRRKPEVISTEPIQPVPDLTDENVGADQLPEDGWTKLARELLERGEFRLAMRAFYLASLAHLAQRNLISIARFKSNHDYEHELRRRAHAFPDLLTVFGDNLSMFERIWYGLHDVNGEIVNQFATNVDRMKGAG